MNQLRIKNDLTRSFVISIEERNLNIFYLKEIFLDVSYSFDMTKILPEQNFNTPLNPLSRGDFLALSFISESLLLRGGQEVCT
jgi:hypothetical protein